MSHVPVKDDKGFHCIIHCECGYRGNVEVEEPTEFIICPECGRKDENCLKEESDMTYYDSRYPF